MTAFSIMSFSINNELAKSLKTLQRIEGLNLSHFVREALAQALRARENKEKIDGSNNRSRGSRTA